MDMQAMVAMQAASAIEAAVDDELARIDNMGEDDFEQIRKKRMEEMKAKQAEKVMWDRNDHGSLTKVNDQKEFFDRCKKSKRVIALFSRDGQQWCNVIKQHLRLLAEGHKETKFIEVDAENSPFLVERLNVWMMPTIICIREGKVHAQFNGLHQIDPTGKFKTGTVEWLLWNCEMLDETHMWDKQNEDEAESEEEDDYSD